MHVVRNEGSVDLVTVVVSLVPAGLLNLALLGRSDLDVADGLAGIVADEWVEVVPNSSETTGIAVHYDTPAAQAPQSVLLAVHPDPEAATWSPEVVEQTLIETLQLARVRMVDFDTLDEVGQLLPALYLANNTDGDTVSTDVLPPP